jgi:hypothetical protein
MAKLYKGSDLVYHGLYLEGAAVCLYTKENWIGRTGGETTTYINGNIYINDTSADGKIHFPHPNNIMAGYYNGVEQTLAQYIARQFTGESAPVEFIANNAQLAKEALALSSSQGKKYSKGNSTKPVYFVNGVPVECNSYPSLTSYATREWVNDNFAGKNDIPNLSGYATEEWVTKNFAGKSDVPDAPDLSGYAT